MTAARESRAMAKRFDPATLFEPWKARPAPAVYPTDEASLDAVKRRTKGMSLFWSSIDELGPRTSEIAHWLRLAAPRDLCVVLQAEPGRDDVRVFLARPEELWRVPAYDALWKTAFVDGRWSDATENQMSYLLGYSATQRAAWLTAQREATPAWGSAVVYALLDADRRAAIEAVGRRCLGTEGLTLFTAGNRVLKTKVHALLPRGSTLARVGLERDAFQRLLGRKTSTSVPKKQMPALNAALLSNVQFLTRSGWS